MNKTNQRKIMQNIIDFSTHAIPNPKSSLKFAIMHRVTYEDGTVKDWTYEAIAKDPVYYIRDMIQADVWNEDETDLLNCVTFVSHILFKTHEHMYSDKQEGLKSLTKVVKSHAYSIKERLPEPSEALIALRKKIKEDDYVEGISDLKQLIRKGKKDEQGTN